MLTKGFKRWQNVNTIDVYEGYARKTAGKEMSPLDLRELAGS